jgi:hypothetical protein
MFRNSVGLEYYADTVEVVSSSLTGTTKLFIMEGILREGDYVYDIEDNTEWLLMENPGKHGSANSVCTYAPEGCVYKIGTPFKRCYFDEFGRLRTYLKMGKNPNKEL